MSTVTNHLKHLCKEPEAQHWVCYAAKAAVLFLLLRMFAVFGSHMQAYGVALLWVLLSCLSALGYAYFRVVRKASQRFLYEAGRKFSRLNSGRTLAFGIAFFAAALCVFGLFCDVLRWNTLDWGIVMSGAIFYPAAYYVLLYLIGDQFAEGFRQPSITRAAIWATTAYLCVAFLVASFTTPVVDYPSAYEAFIAAQQEFGDSPVELLRQLGILSSVAEGMTNWGTSQAANTSPYLYAGLKIFLNALSLAAVGSMLGACSIGKTELRRMFADFPIDSLNLSSSDETNQKPTLRYRYAVVGACMPILLFALLVGTNAHLQEVSNRGELSIVKKFASSTVNLTVFTIDGEPYDAQALQAARDKASDELKKLSADAKETLIPLVNASFDARLSNIDAYIDDYYSLPADYERLWNLVGGNVEQFATQRLQEKIDSGIDDSELISKLEEYNVQSQAILDQFENAKVSSKIEGVPDWLIKSKETADANLFDDTIEPDQKLLSLMQRFSVSVATGTAAGVATKAVSKKLIERTVEEKEFFGNIVSRITNVLASRATGGMVGAAIGTAAGPAGTILGAAVGTAAGIGVDYALLKVDENQNRESYKKQIIQAIEEERTEVLSLLE